MRKEKGFTLVELLAIIIILAIILAIAIPSINDYKEERKKNLFFALAKNIVRELDYENMETSSSLYSVLSSLNIEVSNTQVDLDKSSVILTDDGVKLNLFGTGTYDGLYLCNVSGSLKSANYEDTSCVEGSYKSIVTLDASGGVVSPSTLEVTAGEEYGELPTPTKDNSNFLGWYYNKTKIESNTKVTSIVNHTLVSKWQYNSKITVILNGGTLDQTFEERYLEGSSLILKNPTKTDNTFVGWKISSGNGNLSGNNLIFGNSDITIEAQFVYNKSELVVDLDGGTGIDASGYHDIGTSVQLSVPAKTGYTFAGWKLVSGNGIISGNTITIGNQKTSVKATYTVNKYVVIFDAQGGVLEDNTLEVSYDATYGTLPTPTKKYYTFLGWYTEKTGGTKIESSNIVKITDTLILYAHWEEAELTYTQVISNYSCANSYAGEAADRIFSYSGNCKILQDSNGWRVKFTSSGTLRFYLNTKIDAFVVGGGTSGGNGYRTATDPGKGGTTVLSSNISLVSNTDYAVVVGAASSNSSFNSVVATAGGTTVAAGQCEFLETTADGSTCAFADNGYQGHYGANGHYTAYGGGSGSGGGDCYGGTVISSTAGAANTGGGGGSGNRWEGACTADGSSYYGFGGYGSAGGSGVVIIRNAR